ncbi:MAG TPA: aromatic ring-hydroxylating dioxygenase subunit alpha [Gammaproteobacteria bacterium]|nr:aromatic ring-hydroxylating dioxygenase subunit alpha [SAR202 cluster bacterium]HAD38295.1 aromatic ring-hydroxylating dioxygenase subunit alpha [Gammaproteobacteria bacterium]HBK77618.1 aromatic ring-hydroxylating dioxygenase subunit alpha [Gammaproteobacteria bacterium]HHZ71886.1 aromatic ring-hydroxylating dioxygenase subunit alpha [Gammaproteobacteria bacterium]HIM87029.1 aromatic ring-hydroxylating dioxygenase subunit alpha [Gammaproteobacteria bacterium]
MLPANLFDSTHYEDVRRPLIEASTLPSWCYTSEAFYQREVEQIFLKQWNFAGRLDEIPDSGDYMSLDFCGESVIVIRGKDDVVRAFANVCRHRSARLLEGRGRCRTIVCPYHSWVYDLDGTLLRMKGMEQTAGFDPAENGLIPLQVESWAGFLFVSFANDVMPLEEHLGDMTEQYASYRFADMLCVRRRSYDLKCNWKLYIENAMEDYHTATVHKDSIGNQDCVPVSTKGQWAAIHLEAADTIAVLTEDNTTLPHIENLSGLAAKGTYFSVIYPGTFFATHQDCMWWLQLLPHAPDRTTVVIGSCFPRSSIAREDFAREVLKYYARWDKALPEDNAISERQQQGLNSRSSRPGRLSYYEPCVHAIANWVLDQTIKSS